MDVLIRNAGGLDRAPHLKVTSIKIGDILLGKPHNDRFVGDNVQLRSLIEMVASKSKEHFT